MNTDIRISTDFPTHPKTIMLIARLGLAAVWSLISLWTFAAKHRPDGVLRGLTIDALRIACGYAGDMNKFLSVLKEPETRFLDNDTPEAWIVLHDWQDHNPWAYGAQARSEKARELARLRWDAERNAGRSAKGKATRSKTRIAPSPILSSPPPKDTSGKPDGIPYQEIIDYLNSLTGQQYRATSKGTKEHIAARWNEGWTLDEFKRAIDNMSEKWLNDPEMCQYLRPATLFAKDKFDGYVNRIVSKKDRQAGPQRNGVVEMLDRIKQASGKEVRDGSLASA